MNESKLKTLLQQQISSPLNDTAFLRELIQITKGEELKSDQTLDISMEISTILTDLYAQQRHTDLIVQIKPSLASATINPASGLLRDNLPGQSTLAPSSDKLPSVTLGATISRPSQLERIEEHGIYSSKSLIGQTLDLGDAWLATDDVLSRQILLRELDNESEKEEASVQQFVREAQIAGQLEHPNILPVYSLAWSPDNSPYYTMKFPEGITLAKHIETLHQNSLSIDRTTLRESIQILLSVCNAISYAHSRGVYHGQLASDAISLGEFGEVLVMNWSNAVIVDADQDSVALSKHDRTAIASLLYEIVTGHKPDPTEMNQLARLPAKAPNPLKSILRQAFLDDTRYTDLTDLATDLRAFLNDKSLIAHDDTFAESVTRWARHHPMHVLFGSATLLLLTFSLLTETYILRKAKNEAAATLSTTQEITRLLLNDNQLIAGERETQEDAAATALNALEEANQQLKSAQRSNQAALRQRDLSRRLQAESKALRKIAENDYAEAVKQETLALTLLKQAEAANLAARQATLEIRKQSVSTLERQINQQLLRGRNDLASQNVRALYPLITEETHTSIHTPSLLKAIASYSYIHCDQNPTKFELPRRDITRWCTSPELPIAITEYLPKESTTKLYILERDLQFSHEVPGEVVFHFQDRNRIITISNSDAEAFVGIIKGDEITFGRLPAHCNTAILDGDLLYTGLANGHVLTFSIEGLTTSSPIVALPALPQRLALSPDGRLLACNFETKLQIFNLSNSAIERTITLPSKCHQLWFPSNNSIALLTDQYFVNEYLFDEAGTRRIRYRPPSDDRQLVDYCSHRNTHYLLFSKGTLVRLSKTLNTNSIHLDNSVHSNFLHVGPNCLLLKNRDGVVSSIEPATLAPNSAPIILKEPIVAATRNASTVTLATADGFVGQYKQSITTASKQIVVPDYTNQVELTMMGAPLVKTSENTISKVLPNGEIRDIYQHQSPIKAFRTLGNGAFIAVTDDKQITLFQLTANATPKNSHVLPLRVQLNTFVHHPMSGTALLSSEDTLYHFLDEQVYTYSHPAKLAGLIRITLSADALKAFITSSDQSSEGYLVALTEISYSSSYDFDGFIRDVFWVPDRESFLLICAQQNASGQPDLIELDDSGVIATTSLPYQINNVVLNTQNNELIIATTGKELFRYATSTHQRSEASNFAYFIDDMQLTSDNKAVLLTTTSGMLVLDPDTLTPLTPMHKGNFLQPVLRGGVYNILKRTSTGLTIVNLPTLLGDGITQEQMNQFYSQ